MAREQKQIHVRSIAPRRDRAGERVARQQQRQVEGAPIVCDEATSARQLVLNGFEPRVLPRRAGEKQLDDAQAVYRVLVLFLCVLAVFKRLEMQSRTFSVFALAFPIFQAPKSYSEICDAIEAGDADKACEILSVFIEITRQQKKKALKDFGPDVLTGIYGFIAKSYELRDRQKMEADHADT